MRVAIIGARRVRQGLGPFLASFAVEAGAEISAVVGSSMENAEIARAELQADLGQSPTAVTDIEHVVAAGTDALFICSPHETHERWLADALRCGLHVLCEKPLLWSGKNPVRRAERLGADFRERGLHLRVNTQWPWTLDSYRELCPEAPALPTWFSMTMPPRRTGMDALLDSVSHPLSMLATLAPDPGAKLQDILVRHMPGNSRLLELSFGYRAGLDTINVDLKLDSSPDERRTTSYALDGHEVRRVVDPATYAMTLETDTKQIPLPDPTRRLVRSFLKALARKKPAAIDVAVVPGMRHLAEIMTAADMEFGDARS